MKLIWHIVQKWSAIWFRPNPVLPFNRTLSMQVIEFDCFMFNCNASRQFH